MNSPRLSLWQFNIVLAALFLFFGMSSARPALAVTSGEITGISERLETDSGMLASATELAGADSDLVKEFKLGVKYGEFAARLWQGDYWGVATDLVKFELEQGIDELKELASEKLLSAGAQRLVGVFTAVKDIGIWLGEKASDAQFNAAVKAGDEIYRENVGQADFRIMMDIWWVQYGKGKITKLNDNDITEEMWISKFGEINALEKKIKEAPVSAEDVKATEKVIKKTAVVHFFKLKYPGIGENVAEELADAIVNKAGSAAIKKIAEKYKAHLDALTAVGAKNETVSSSGICGGLKKEIQESCVERVNFIIEQSRKVLSNEIPFRNYWREIDNTAFDAFGRTVYVSPGDDLLAPVKEARTRIIKAAYENWFGKPIRDIEAELASIKEEFSRQSSRPATGRRGNPPDFSYKNTFFSKDYKDDSLYQGFESGTAQKSYEIFVKDATAMQTANKAVLRFEKVELARMNSLLQSLSRLEARIASIDSSFDSAPGILSFGSGDDRFKDATHDAHNRYTVKWREEITLMKDGKRWLWSYWRTDSWRTDYGINRIIKNLKETILDLENNLANEAELLVSIKKEYTDALERYPKIKKQKDEETAKVVEALEEKFAERDRALAEEKAAEEKKTAEEKSWLQKMLERVKNFTAEKEAKKEAAKQKELEEQQKLEKQGIKTFDVSTEEGRKGYGKSLEEEKEKILEEELEKKQKEEDATKKLLEETRKQTEAEQKRLEETKPQQTGGALSGTLNLPDNFNVEYFSNYPDSALFTKEGALLVNPRSESSKYYATTDFSWSDAYGLMSGSDVSDVGINGTPSENELTRGILELGPGKLESLNSVPDSGYKSFTEYSAWSHYYYDKEYIYPKAGYLYGIKTHDGKYAAIEVISVSKTQLQIKWKYQPNGSNKF